MTISLLSALSSLSFPFFSDCRTSESTRARSLDECDFFFFFLRRFVSPNGLLVRLRLTYFSPAPLNLSDPPGTWA